MTLLATSMAHHSHGLQVGASGLAVLSFVAGPLAFSTLSEAGPIVVQLTSVTHRSGSSITSSSSGCSNISPGGFLLAVLPIMMVVTVLLVVLIVIVVVVAVVVVVIVDIVVIVRVVVVVAPAVIKLTFVVITSLALSAFYISLDQPLSNCHSLI